MSYCQKCRRYIYETAHYCQPWRDWERPESFPSLSATPPTEPGYYWAILRGRTRPEVVAVDVGAGFAVTRMFADQPMHGRTYIVQDFVGWSTRIPEPEVKP